MQAFAAMIDTRERAYAERLPRTDALLATEAADAICALSAPRSNHGSMRSRPAMTWWRSAPPRSARSGRASRALKERVAAHAAWAWNVTRRPTSCA